MGIREEIREHLTGPCASMRTPFQEDGEIDYEGVRNLIDAAIAGGSRSIILTAGDSHFFALSETEIAELTKTTVEQTRGRSLVVAADRQYHTSKAVSFARYCKEIGAGLFMALPPDWQKSCTPQSLADHYAAVAEVMPVMLVTNLFVPRGQAFGLEVLEEVLKRTDRVMALKDDMGGAFPEFARKTCLVTSDSWALISGGQKQNHLNMLPYGVVGFFSLLVAFRPEVTQRYWTAIQENRIQDAVAVIRDYDYPLRESFTRLRGGPDAAVHGMLEIYGISQRWRRRPYHSLTDEEMESLKNTLQRIGLL